VVELGSGLAAEERVSFRTKYPLWLLLFWTALNFVQAGMTELSYDEGYYWVCSRFPDWGYYDQPPMAAILIRAGYALLQNELGVRIIFVLLSTGTIALIHRLTGGKAPLLFFATLFGCFYFHLIGAAAIPSVPLMFFSALFFLALKSYLTDERGSVTAMLAVTIPLMLYSKYQGLLLILFAVAANPSFLKRRSFWIIAGSSVLLLLPHLFWQVGHGFPSVRLHFVERYREPYTPMFIVMYCVEQPLILGPLIGFVILAAAWRVRPEDAYERTLKVTVIGVMVFFLLNSLRGKTEPNWTAPAYIPAILLAHRYLADRVVWRRVLLSLAVPSVVLLLLARIQIISPLLPVGDEVGKQFRGWRAFALEMKGTPVVASSYAVAGKLSFYGGTLVPSLNADSLSSQYEYWHLADSLRGKSVVLLSPVDLGGRSTKIASPAGVLFALHIDAFDAEDAKRLVRARATSSPAR
jgi:hypothetical protein